jgi:hypothetical protein
VKTRIWLGEVLAKSQFSFLFTFLVKDWEKQGYCVMTLRIFCEFKGDILTYISFFCIIAYT